MGPRLARRPSAGGPSLDQALDGDPGELLPQEVLVLDRAQVVELARDDVVPAVWPSDGVRQGARLEASGLRGLVISIFIIIVIIAIVITTK